MRREQRKWLLAQLLLKRCAYTTAAAAAAALSEIDGIFALKNYKEQAFLMAVWQELNQAGHTLYGFATVWPKIGAAQHNSLESWSEFPPSRRIQGV